VTNIRCDVTARRIDADIQEVSTPELAGGVFHGRRQSPLWWKIAAGYLTMFSEHTWAMGYGGWSLFFAPEIVNGLVSLAADWPTELDAGERYKRALRFLADRGAYEPAERVFPD
jgi:hypothetical protein